MSPDAAQREDEAITSCDTNILVRDLAKILKQNGVDTGEKRLYEQLRSDGYLIKEGAVIDRVSRVTPKGQKYFLNRYAAARRRDLPSRASGAEN